MEYSSYLEAKNNDQNYILIIYDIKADEHRTKFAKLLEGYGFRVQKSAFELFISASKLEKLLKKIPYYIDENEDSIRIYKLMGNGKIIMFGKNEKIKDQSLLII